MNGYIGVLVRSDQDIHLPDSFASQGNQALQIGEQHKKAVKMMMACLLPWMAPSRELLLDIPTDTTTAA
jgi:hypothetical protein